MASIDLDPNTLAAEFINQRLDSILDGMKGVLKGASDKVRLRLDRTYRRYLTTIAQKYSRAKSFMHRGESVPLYNFYVPLDITARRRRIPAAGISEVMALSQHTIIIGSGGSGKSMFVRHLLMDALKTKEKIPVFIELRQFNSTDADLIEVIESALNTFGLELGRPYLDEALKLGHFILFLDGFDEVAHDKRERVAANILGFVKRLGRNSVIVTSRQDSALEGWQDFSLHSVAPLTVKQAQSIIELLPYDGEMKARFITDLKKDLFTRHESFLSNPLLLSIMLLSYGQSAGIPTKLSVFYNQAYEALFERHDVLKDGYRRHLRSGLDIQDFARLFAAFCLHSYDKSQIVFSKSEVLNYIEIAQDLVGIEVDRNCYFKDLVESVCLLFEDGIQIVYPHRSFQEYFAARFICEAPPGAQEQLIQRYTKRGHAVRTDALLTMLHEMRPDVVERYYLIPGLQSLFSHLGIVKTISARHSQKLQREIIEGLIAFDEGIGFLRKDEPFMDLIYFALRRCGTQVVATSKKVGTAERRLLERIHEQRKELSRNKRAAQHHAFADMSNPWKDELGKAYLKEMREHEDSIFSIASLKALQKIAESLVAKAQCGEKSLDRILRTS